MGFDEHQKAWIKNSLQDAYDNAKARAGLARMRFKPGQPYSGPSDVVADAYEKAARSYRLAFDRVDGKPDQELEVINGLRRMADDEESGSEAWWILAKAAELLEESR